jgi:hypothetical protein
MSSPTLKMQPILAGAVAAVTAAKSELPLVGVLLATAGTSTSNATRIGTWPQQKQKGV